MGGFSEYDRYDALGLAELVAAKKVSPRELLDEAINRVEQTDAKLNAVNIRMFDQARAEIEKGLPDGPFRGAPWLLKDLGTAYAGVATTYGCAMFRDNVADHDSDLIKRYRRAGLVMFGKTTAPEFGLTTSTESRLYGETHNPWGLAHTPGGSSGGTGAAIAGGIVPASDGSDGGGSIRIPASCCGLVGLKATRARIPMGPDKGEAWSGMSTGGQLSRSVRDTAALLDISTGLVEGDPYAVPAASGPFVAECGVDPGALRIAVQRTTWNGSPVHADCLAALDDASKLCASLGHRVEERTLEYNEERYAQAVRVIVGAHTRRALDDRAAQLGRALDPANDIEPLTHAIYKTAARYFAADYVEAINILHDMGRATARFFETTDIILTPTMATPPMKLGGALRLTHPDGKEFGTAVAATVGFTQFFNMTGTPAISLPLYWNVEGLPIGTQFAARYAGEAVLFRLATQLESARPWFDRRPVF